MKGAVKTHGAGEAFEVCEVEKRLPDLTMEPGLYIRPDEKKVPSAFLGIGVRIEDDVLVTEDGHRVLTAAAPKSVEAMCERAEKRTPRPAKAPAPRAGRVRKGTTPGA